MSQHTCGCDHGHGEKTEKAEEAKAKASTSASAYKILDISEDEILDVHAILRFVCHAAVLSALTSLSPRLALTTKVGRLPASLLVRVEQLPSSSVYEVLVNRPEFQLMKIACESL